MVNRFEVTDSALAGDAITGHVAEALFCDDLQLDLVARTAEQRVLQSMTEHEARVFREEKAEYALKLEQYKKDYAQAFARGLAIPRYPLKPGSVISFEIKVTKAKREILEDARRTNCRF